MNTAVHRTVRPALDRCPFASAAARDLPRGFSARLAQGCKQGCAGQRPNSHGNSAASSGEGFTLVEIMIVVVIIGLLAALAIPGYLRVQRHSQNSRVVNDLRVFSQAFETYSTQNGAWPANASPGAVPAGIGTADFKVSVWQATTVIGGQWNWDLDVVSGIAAGISISNFTCDDTQLAEIDAMIDDGNLATGNFQKVSNNRVTYILQ